MSPKSKDPKAIYSRNIRSATVGIIIAKYCQLEISKKCANGD